MKCRDYMPLLKITYMEILYVYIYVMCFDLQSLFTAPYIHTLASILFLNSKQQLNDEIES